ncbi:enoyl-CoA hydratase-related protein [Bordetella genomosp. 13]|uniref:enoyl-CoA hydratase-related protein n=1 Tax=Bordetella genomosp. 13 TaxID=463040 RepID=UPI0016435EE4|nr:enoyl-CoA hydratase-related protein [Bordetella genomosp. 13]
MQYTGPDQSAGGPRQLGAVLEAGVLTVTLDRPGHGNAIDVGMTREMVALLGAVHGDPQVRVVVLRGAGADFCAGMDAADFQDVARHGEQALRAARQMFDDWRVRRLRLLPQPVIAMVHGACQAEAIGILEGCDIVLAAEDARFALRGDQAPGFPGGVAAKTVSRVMTPRAASFFALTGESFDGREAERNGLATLAVPAQRLEEEVYALARDMAAKEQTALQFTKETLLHVGEMSWDGVLNFTAAKFAELKMLQAGRPSARAFAVESFLAGQSKPGLGG